MHAPTLDLPLKLPRLDCGQRIERRRRDLKMKQEVLAITIGVSQSTVSRIELGMWTPDDYLREKIETALQLTPGALL